MGPCSTSVVCSSYTMLAGSQFEQPEFSAIQVPQGYLPDDEVIKQAFVKHRGFISKNDSRRGADHWVFQQAVLSVMEQEVFNCC